MKELPVTATFPSLLKLLELDVVYLATVATVPFWNVKVWLLDDVF